MTDWARVQNRFAKPDFLTSRILLGLDFDGTLSKIVDSPRKAVLSSDTRRLLRALIQRPDIKVAILSGRGLEDIKKRVGLPGVYYAGNHGLQIDGPGLQWTHPHAGELDAASWRPLEEDLKDIPGAIVERKRLGMAVHYRKVPKRYIRRLADRVRTRFAELRNRFRILRGKKTYDIRSLVPWNKGHALDAIRNQLTGDWMGVFIGDDRTDEEGFRTLGPRALTIRVGRVNASEAQYIFSDRKQVDRLLKSLAARSSPSQEA
ncbi:MAG TPA: trehalose-phosphatase [Elusimicrobia bacterium]|nr:MAG: trehalose-phosphatase [Elusimicrobia bacterium GWC2_65_9]OHC65904.1 MAG: trehalose-phosphatase [Rhodocyclales bacterium GWA2_65_19]HAZ07343.1 trehalose-phosphatase [Elusimicrobiota bacterium]